MKKVALPAEQPVTIPEFHMELGVGSTPEEYLRTCIKTLHGLGYFAGCPEPVFTKTNPWR
jgi:hypothetical protein